MMRILKKRLPLFLALLAAFSLFFSLTACENAVETPAAYEESGISETAETSRSARESARPTFDFLDDPDYTAPGREGEEDREDDRPREQEDDRPREQEDDRPREQEDDRPHDEDEGSGDGEDPVFTTEEASGQAEDPTEGPSSESPPTTASPSAYVTADGTYTDKDHVAAYIRTFGRLPSNYITKTQAKALGWESDNLWEYAPGKSIGGDRFGNREGLLPKKSGRQYYECDIDYKGGSRNAKRIVYSNDGLIFYTDDHYASYTQLYP